VRKTQHPCIIRAYWRGKYLLQSRRTLGMQGACARNPRTNGHFSLRSFLPASCIHLPKVRPPFETLHSRHTRAMFPSSAEKPMQRGMMWSRVKVPRTVPQYAHRSSCDEEMWQSIRRLPSHRMLCVDPPHVFMKEWPGEKFRDQRS